MDMTARKGIEISTWIGTAALLLLLAWFASKGYLTNPEALQALLRQAGWTGPLLFMALQVLQVIIPVIPGGVSSAIGVLAFGPFWGFVYNYLGLVAGSILAFWLVRRYGKPFIRKITSPESYDKYIGWLDKGTRFDWFFAAAIFFPCAPDDILCMIAGLTKMSYAKFVTIIVLGKPLALVAYSMGLTSLLQWVGTLL